MTRRQTRSAALLIWAAYSLDAIHLDSVGVLSFCSSDIRYVITICWCHSMVEYRMVWRCKSRIRSMVVDCFCSITASIREFVRLVLVEVYRNDHCDSLYLLDGDASVNTHQWFWMLVASSILTLDMGLVDTMLSSFRGYWAPECMAVRNDWFPLLATGKTMGALVTTVATVVAMGQHPLVLGTFPALIWLWYTAISAI